MRSAKSFTYRDSGVDIAAGNTLARRIPRIAKATHNERVLNGRVTAENRKTLSGVGGFGALFELPVEEYQQPVLVSATDGVGTKLMLATQLNHHATIGVDLVAMCVNDIITCGAKPLYFLDYFATGALDVAHASAVIDSIARGCQAAECALVGGETAEMPGLYQRGDYDLAGFAVGIVEKARILNAARVQVGDCILGLASSGVHSNGFSLIRKLLDRHGAAFSEAFIVETLLKPTRIYVKSLLRLLAQVEVSALCHITGGGLLQNPPRVLPHGADAEIHRSSWQMPQEFQMLQELGNIKQPEMFRTFNCGIGMLVIVRAEHASTAAALLAEHGERVMEIGRVVPARGDAPQVRLRA